MHSFESNNQPPAFLVKLWHLVEDAACNDVIAWSDSGTTFVIKDQIKFSQELLPQKFKHNNMASFIRQLNMYGFRKIMNYEKSGLHNSNDEMEFYHSFFCKGQYDLVKHIKRKSPNIKATESGVKSNPRDILTDLSSIREKQENMDNMLLKMKQENELLWRELTNMRKKHKAQEHVIQKVIHFLVSIVQRSNPNISVQRKMPRMLHDSSGNQGKSQVACALDVLRNKNPSFITVPSEKIVSPLGPVIHEVTEFEHDNEESTLSPSVNSPEERTENSVIPFESECPINYSLNSPINTSATFEPLSILEPLQPSAPALNADAEESVLGIPLEYINTPPSNVISIPEDEPCNNVISLPDSSDVGVSFNFSASPSALLNPVSSKPEFDDSLLSESLQTPKIPTVYIEDVHPLSLESEKKTADTQKKDGANSNTELQELHSEHNYQLSLPNSSSLSISTNGFSNGVLNVDEELDWLQDQLKAGNLNFEASKLLGLFSADDVANNETLAGEIADQSYIKSEPNDVIGNELVQFNPSLLEEVQFDGGNNNFLECLNQNTEISSENIKKQCKEPRNFLADVLIQADQAVASEAAEYLLSNESTSNQKSPRRKKVQKSQLTKRRKMK